MESVYSIQHRRRHRFSYWNLPLGFANKVPVSHDAFKLIQSQFSPVQWLHLQKNSIQSLSLSFSLELFAFSRNQTIQIAFKSSENASINYEIGMKGREKKLL